jgi:hypothetical protein
MKRSWRYRRRNSGNVAVLSAILALTAWAWSTGAQETGGPVAEPIPAPQPRPPAQAIPPPEVRPPAELIPPAQALEGSGLVRVTSSFELKHAAALLKKVAKLFHAGFVRQDAEALAKDIDALPAETSRRWEFTVIYKRNSYPLQIRARLDEFGMLDLDFFCAPAAAAAVRGAVDGYLNSHRL